MVDKAPLTLVQSHLVIAYVPRLNDVGGVIRLGNDTADDLIPVNGIDVGDDAEISSLVDDLHHVGGVNELLGGDAAPIDACPAKWPAFYDGGCQALRRRGVRDAHTLTPSQSQSRQTRARRCSVVVMALSPACTDPSFSTVQNRHSLALARA